VGHEWYKWLVVVNTEMDLRFQKIARKLTELLIDYEGGFCLMPLTVSVGVYIATKKYIKKLSYF